MKSVNQYGAQRESMLKTIEMKNFKLQAAMEYQFKLREMSKFCSKGDKFSQTARNAQSSPKNNRPMPFDLQRGHLGLEIKEVSESPSIDQLQMMMTKKSRTTNSRFMITGEIDPMKSLLDFRKTTKDINFQKDLARLPFPQLDPSENEKGAKSYNINWKGVEKRQDIACLPFGKSPGRDFYVKPYPAASTDGYYEVLEQIALNEQRMKKSRKQTRSPVVPVPSPTTAEEEEGDMRSTVGFRTVKSKTSKLSNDLTKMLPRPTQTQQSQKQNKFSKTASGYIISFSKILPRSLSQKSQLPSFMQKGTACSRFAVEFMKGLDEKTNVSTPIRHPSGHPSALDIPAENSFDGFFGEA